MRLSKSILREFEKYIYAHVCVCMVPCNKMAFHKEPKSQNRLWVHYNPDQDKTVLENEWKYLRAFQIKNTTDAITGPQNFSSSLRERYEVAHVIIRVMTASFNIRELPNRHVGGFNNVRVQIYLVAYTWQKLLALKNYSWLVIGFL